MSGSMLNKNIKISRQGKKWMQRKLDKETEKLLYEDAKYFMHQSMSTPCIDVLKTANGIYLENMAGKRLMDFHGNNVHQVGYRNSKVIDAIKKQLDELAFCPRRFTNIPAIKLAKALCDLTPESLSKVLFCPGGAEAVEMALLLARIATKKFKTISMWESFHGATMGALSIGGLEAHRGEIGPLLTGTEHVPPAECYRCPWGYENQNKCHIECAKYVEYVLEKDREISAIIAESIRTNIAFAPPLAYWEIIQKACNKYGALLVFDEIPNCLGRTGKMFAFQHYDIVPDIAVIGKGLGGAVFPLAAVIANEKLDIMPRRNIGHFTHEKNAVATAAGLAVIKYIKDNNLLKHALMLGEKTLRQMKEMMTRHRLIGDVRGKGFLMAMELVKDPETKERAVEEAEMVMHLALEKGMSFKIAMGNTILLCPALTITEAKMYDALEILDWCLSKIEKNI